MSNTASNTTKVNKKSEYDPNRLAKNIFIALVLGIITGLIFMAIRGRVSDNAWATINNLLFQDITAEGAEHAIGIFYIGGQLFIRSLQLVIVPMVFTSIALAICSITDARTLGRVTAKTLLFFLLTTVVAVLLAAFVGIAIYNAGLFNANVEGLTASSGTTSSNPLNVILNIIPSNIGASFSTNGSVLAVVFLAAAVGLCMNKLGEEKSATLRHLFQEISDVIVKFLMFVINYFAPVAIFMLLSRTFASYGTSYLKPALVYVIVTVILELLYLFIGYPMYVAISSKQNPWKFLKKILPVIMLGFSTSSSAATLALNEETATSRLGVDTTISSFVLPLGMTVNMDGTALMDVVATLFIAGCAGYNVTIGSVLLIGALAVIASVGTPAAPGAGAVVLFTILSGVGFTSDAALLAYTLILSINRPIEMLVTALNVSGDAATCMYVAKSENLLNEDVFNAN